jgi:uncharacterized membrane-anchored protein YjiN (DUF445 family)
MFLYSIHNLEAERLGDTRKKILMDHILTQAAVTSKKTSKKPTIAESINSKGLKATSMLNKPKKKKLTKEEKDRKRDWDNEEYDPNFVDDDEDEDEATQSDMDFIDDLNASEEEEEEEEELQSQVMDDDTPAPRKSAKRSVNMFTKLKETLNTYGRDDMQCVTKLQGTFGKKVVKPKDLPSYTAKKVKEILKRLLLVIVTQLNNVYYTRQAEFIKEVKDQDETSPMDRYLVKVSYFLPM